MPGGNLKDLVEQNRIHPNPREQEATAHIQYIDDAGDLVRHRPIFGRGLDEDTAKKLFCSIVHGMKYLHETVNRSV